MNVPNINFNLTTIHKWECQNVKEEYKILKEIISQERLR